MSTELNYITYQPAGEAGLKFSETASLRPDVFYMFLAYTHPDCPEVFFGAVASFDAKWVESMGCRCHLGLVTAVRAETIPPKPVDEVWSISQAEYVRLRRCELLWWVDFDGYMWTNPRAHRSAAVRFAHDEAIREQRVNV